MIAGHSWSNPRVINGAAAFCGGRWPGQVTGCDDSQGSQPTVSPATGQVWVGFLNGDTVDEDQYSLSRRPTAEHLLDADAGRHDL